MAARDLMPYKSFNGADLPKFQGPINASESFGEGEPLTWNAQGELTEALTIPATVAGISAVQATVVDGTAFAAGTVITVYGVPDDQLFICRNYSSGGSGVAATPTAGNAIGVTAGLVLTGGTWFVDTGAANQITEIMDVIDLTTGDSISNPLISAHTAGAVIFRFI